MFGIGWSEFIFLAILALLVLGPDKLPEMARQLGKWTRELRKAASELQGEFVREFNKDDLADLTRPALTTMLESANADTNKPEADFGAIVRNKPQTPTPDTPPPDYANNASR